LQRLLCEALPYFISSFYRKYFYNIH